MRRQFAALAGSLYEVKATHPIVCCLCCSRAIRLHSSDRPRSAHPSYEEIRNIESTPTGVAISDNIVAINAKICSIPVGWSLVAGSEIALLVIDALTRVAPIVYLIKTEGRSDVAREL